MKGSTQRKWRGILLGIFVLCLAISSQAIADLKITQIMYNMYGNDGDGNSAWEWVEIYNDGASAVNLSGYVFDDGNATAHGSANISGGSISAGGFAYLYNEDEIDKDDFVKIWGGVNAIGVTGWAANGLNNGGDKVGIWSSYANYSGDHASHSNAIDSVQYTNASPWPVADDSGSIYLTSVTADNDTGSNWALAVSSDLGDSISGSRTLVDSKESVEYAAINGYPRLQIVQILANMPGDDGTLNGSWEFVEIYNDWPVAADVSGYVFDDKNATAHGSSNISSGTIYPGRSAYFFNEDEIDDANFQAAWGPKINVIGVTGWAANALNNGGDGVGLWGSYSDYSSDNATHDNAIDSVDYTTTSPWPTDVGAQSIYLTDVDTDNDNGVNWEEAISDDRGFGPAGAPGLIARAYDAGGIPGMCTASIDMSPKGEAPIFRYRCYTGTRPSYVSEHTALGNITHSTSYDVVSTNRGTGFGDFIRTDFNGSNEYIQSSSVLDTRDLSGDDSFTIMAWFKADSVTGYKTIISNDEDSTGISLKIVNGKLRGWVRFTDNNGSLSTQQVGTAAEDPTLSTDVWYNVVFYVRRIESSNTYEMRTYINNELAAIKTLNNILPNGYIRQSAEKPIVADEPEDGIGGGTSPFDGQIYAVTVYNYPVYLNNFIKLKRVRDGSRYFGDLSSHDTWTTCMDHFYHKTAMNELYSDAMDEIVDKFICPFSNDDYCPQGIAYNGVNGKLYVSFYWINVDGDTGSYPSILAEIEPDTHELERCFQLKDTGGNNMTSHVGGVAYFSSNIYIPDGSTIYRYNLNSAGTYTFNPDTFAYPRMDQNPFTAAEAYSMNISTNDSISCLSTDTDYNGDYILWVADSEEDEYMKLLGYQLSAGSKDVSTTAAHSYTLPVYNVQGIQCYSATSTQLKFYIMTSKGDLPSELYDITYNRGTSTAASYTLLSYLPPAGEDLTMTGGTLWTLSETGAKYYQKRDSATNYRWTNIYPHIFGIDVSDL